ncbi:MAG TPA: subclass B3 metallo-beta-lactamase [Sphingomicrobium sp.]|nr:subclass B3 metallo-beta-lactamase [Sphingomicrobium sp.]
MFASLLAAALAQGFPIVVPLQKPPARVERPVAPIEIAGPAFAARCKDWDAWGKRAPPVRIHANAYLVGTCGISSILITGNSGHILIDGGTEAGADLIAENIRSLGFRLGDVRILLHSHEHFDHVGGIDRLQRLTGGRLFASPAAARVFATGTAGAGDPQAGMHKPFPAARVDRVLRAGDTVRLGNLMLTPIATPGHTPGALSWHWVGCDGGVCRTIVYADSLSAVSRDNYRFSDHPDYLAAFRASIARVAALDCDILLTPHPSASDMVRRLGRAALFNANACRNYAAALTKQLDERLASEAGTEENRKP